jgi:hypothetical protein
MEQAATNGASDLATGHERTGSLPIERRIAHMLMLSRWPRMHTAITSSLAMRHEPMFCRAEIDAARPELERFRRHRPASLD